MRDYIGEHEREFNLRDGIGGRPYYESFCVHNLALHLVLSEVEKNSLHYIDPNFRKAVKKLWNRLSRDDKNLIASYIEDKFEYSTKQVNLQQDEEERGEELDILAEFFNLLPKGGKIPANVKRYIEIIKEFRAQLAPRFGENFVGVVFEGRG